MATPPSVNPCQIQILPELVQNKIAAGEVVERPASVVKELVENALDAGGQAIHVELRDGGQRLIRVSDDGHGMSEEDLRLAVQRHATSKIADAEDIFRIRSMGFRGEALPSIGSVSRLWIASCVRGADTGHAIRVDAGKFIGVEPCAPRLGTQVEVADLFCNTPARLKFMKRPNAEAAAASEAMTRLALGWPQCAFSLRSQERSLLEVPAADSALDRAAALFGKELAGHLVPVLSEERSGLQIHGLVARAPESRANSRGIYMFVNRRWIRHAGIVRVVRDAFQGRLPPGRYPFALLYLEVDPEEVDVNVHPTKEEVRFEKERLVTGAVRKAVEEALGSAPHHKVGIGGIPVPGAKESGIRPGLGKTEPPCTAAERVSEATGAYLRGRGAGQAAVSARASEGVQTRASVAPVQRGVGAAGVQKQLDVGAPPKHRVVAQVGNRYLVVESEAGVVLVDQHALHERWNFEKLKDSKAPVTSQQLLAPQVIALAPGEAALMDAILPVLRSAGFEVEAFGEAAVSVSAVPEIMRPSDVKRIVQDVFSDVERAEEEADRLRDRVLASVACRSAVLAGTRLAEAQMVSLLDQLVDAQAPLTCPHGRPTTVTITWEELERRFGRR